MEMLLRPRCPQPLHFDRSDCIYTELQPVTAIKFDLGRSSNVGAFQNLMNMYQQPSLRQR